MIVFVKKRTLFFLSVLVAGVLGLIGGHFRSNYSQKNSLLVNTAKADVPPSASCDLNNWTQVQCDCYFTGVGCSGSDGCCSGPTNDTGVDASTDADASCADATDEGGGSGGSGGSSGTDEGGDG